MRVPVLYQCPLDEAVLLVHGWTLQPPVPSLADHLLTLRLYPDPTWLQRQFVRFA